MQPLAACTAAIVVIVTDTLFLHFSCSASFRSFAYFRFKTTSLVFYYHFSCSRKGAMSEGAGECPGQNVRFSSQTLTAVRTLLRKEKERMDEHVMQDVAGT